MILGSVNASREAIIQIAVLSDSKQIKSIRAVTDNWSLIMYWRALQ
jgi:hypothetical protein